MLIIGQELSCNQIFHLFKEHVKDFMSAYENFKVIYEKENDIDDDITNHPVDYANFLLDLCNSDNFNLLNSLHPNLILNRPFNTIYDENNEENLIFGIDCITNDSDSDNDDDKISLDLLTENIKQFKSFCKEFGLPIKNINCYTS